MSTYDEVVLRFDCDDMLLDNDKDRAPGAAVGNRVLIHVQKVEMPDRQRSIMP